MSHSALEVMLAVEEIKRLKYRYLRTLDLKRWDEFADVFVPEATGDYGGLAFGSRDEIVGYMREMLGPRMVTLHQCHHPEITLDGDLASGVWYLEDRVIMPDLRLVLEGAAFYEDRYVRTSDGWRIVHTGYERTYETTMSMDDVPSYDLKIGKAYG
jgi:SnoaL-like domain